MAGVLQTAPSFSVHSVAESSGAAISEAEEIHEVTYWIYVAYTGVYLKENSSRSKKLVARGKS